MFIDAILAFIGSESLTDGEFATFTINAEEYTKALYEEIKAVLLERESISGQLKKLKSFFLAKGVDLNAPAILANSQILIGGPV